MRAQSSANVLIDPEAGVNGDASGDKGTYKKNYYLDKFIVADNKEY